MFVIFVVCIDVVSGVEASMTEEERKDMETVETKISKYCSQKKIGAEQKKIVGGKIQKV